MTKPAASAGSTALLERSLFFDAVEAAYEISGVEGNIPEWLRGDFYINGPARFERGGRRYNNWLDGDGMVAALHFTERGVSFASRFVQTRKLGDEQSAGAFRYRAFGTAFPGDLLRRNLMLESPVNVNVCTWGDRLLAFGEQSLPMELHPRTLETAGEFDFGGSLNEVSPFSAHAKVDPLTGNLLNFGMSSSARQPTLSVYEFSLPGTLIRRSRVPLQLQHSNHDFGFTRRHVVFFLSPLIMDYGRFIEDRVSVMDSLSWEPEKGSRILVVPRDPKAGASFEVPAGAGYCLHLINCFEEGGRLTMDILELDGPVYGEYQPLPELYACAPKCHPVRYVVDLETKKLMDRRAMTYDLCSDFPCIDTGLLGAAYGDFWFLGISRSGAPGSKFFDQLARGSWKEGGVADVYRAPPGEFLAGEPVFIGHPDEPEGGLVLVQSLNPAKDEAGFLIFNAFAVSRGPSARIRLKDRIHPLFHACFCPRATA